MDYKNKGICRCKKQAGPYMVGKEYYYVQLKAGNHNRVWRLSLNDFYRAGKRSNTTHDDFDCESFKKLFEIIEEEADDDEER